jgi:hypothetical protein
VKQSPPLKAIKIVLKIIYDQQYEIATPTNVSGFSLTGMIHNNCDFSYSSPIQYSQQPDTPTKYTNLFNHLRCAAYSKYRLIILKRFFASFFLQSLKKG